MRRPCPECQWGWANVPFWYKSMSAIKLIPQTEHDKDRIVSSLEEVIEDVKAGRVIGVLVLMERPDNFGFKRTNIKLETAIALCNRVSYRLNQEWDG